MKKIWITLLVVSVSLVLLVFGCLSLVGSVAVHNILQSQSKPVEEAAQPVIVVPTQAAIVASPTLPIPTPSPSLTPIVVNVPLPTASLASVAGLGAPPAAVPTDTLGILENAVVPVNDPIDLAERLEGKENLPRNLEFPTTAYQVGAKQSFWVTNSETNQNFQINATLRSISNHVYFWAEDDISIHPNDLSNLIAAFEKKIIPTDNEFFGSEWNPGVDADPHLYILYAKKLGSFLAGYFSSADEYLPVVRPDSNGHEMFVLNADTAPLNDPYTYGVLAHEYQHMIHWYRDRNEETWMNEGFSNLAVLLNGYGVGGADQLYAKNPDIQLTDWPNDSTKRVAHYGASFLFLDYFLNRFGEQATKMVVSEAANGMVSIDKVLASLGVKDPSTGKLISADDVFADWELASYLHDPKVADGRYTYQNYPQAPKPKDTETIRSCTQASTQRDVSQYGADYIAITCKGNYQIHFEGSKQVGVLPVKPHSGSYAFFSNRGDESDMTLTRTFDFSNSSAPLTLTYWTWYDLEKDYDYLYLTASLDGKHWQILTTPSGTGTNPSGKSYGWGYTGTSGSGKGSQWIQEKVDLSQFAGKKVQLRFEYVTDAAVNGNGFLLDDVSVPETGYSTDFEKDNGGWVGSGFVRIQNDLPQTFRLALISKGTSTTLQMIELNQDNIADIPINIGNGVNEVVLVVSGITRFTTQKADYQFSFQHQP